MLLQLKPIELEAVSSYWYLKFGTHWVGPASYIEILQMLKIRKINRQIMVRSGNAKDEFGGEWHVMSQVPQFSVEFIDEFSKFYVPKGREFHLIRKFVRVHYDAKALVVSESGAVFEAECSELSAGGAKIKVPADSLDENENLTIQFFYNKKLKLKSFKTKAKVLRLAEIQFDDNDKKKGAVSEIYAVEFEDLKPKHKKMLLKSTQLKIKALAGFLKQQNKHTVGVMDLNAFSQKYPHLMLSP